MQAGELRREIQLRLGLLRDGHGGLDEHKIVPHDGRGVAFAGERDFPLHVLRFAPFGRRVAVRRDAVGERAAPLAPVLIGGCGGKGTVLIKVS